MKAIVEPVTQHRVEPEEWNSRHREYLLHFALSRVSDYGTAEDLVQETFLSAWKARDRFRGDCSERTFLTGVLRNKIIDFYRKRGRRPSFLGEDVDGTQGEESAEGWFDRQPDTRDLGQPLAFTEKAEFMAELEEAVDHLPETMQRAFRMRELEGRSTEEITSQLNISSNNLWVLIHRAKHNLQERLRTNWLGLDEFGSLHPS